MSERESNPIPEGAEEEREGALGWQSLIVSGVVVFEELLEAASVINQLIAEDENLYEQWVHEADQLEDALERARNFTEQLERTWLQVVAKEGS